MVHWLSSEQNPLRIDAVPAPGTPGLIGMTLCPGKKDPYAAFGAWDRDLAADLQTIRDWGASTLVTLLQQHEFTLLGLPDFEVQVSGVFRWLWLPIEDNGVPDAGFEERWPAAGAELRGRLVAGERILVHCRAGLGRTGMIAARLLVEFGMTPLEALNAVRRERPGTVETLLQERYVLTLAQRDGVGDRQAPR
jgi:ADP-ribosyl-[dinitrogen reductase] hydrolase